MQSIILDTNVIVSALITRQSPPALIVDNLVLDGKVNLCISDAILAEYIQVLGRDKFSVFPEFRPRAEMFLSHLYAISLKFNPEVRLDLIKDESDNRFLELALTARADFLITGNTNDFTMSGRCHPYRYSKRIL